MYSKISPLNWWEKVVFDSNESVRVARKNRIVITAEAMVMGERQKLYQMSLSSARASRLVLVDVSMFAMS